MYYINILKQELSIAKTYEHNLLDEMPVVDRHQCHMAAKFGMFVDEDHRKLLCLLSYFHYKSCFVCAEWRPLKSLPSLLFNALIIPILRIAFTIFFHYSFP